MSVDFLVCKNCGETFCDCGEYVSCESCGEHWCCEECAEEDGYNTEYCDLGCECSWSIDITEQEEACQGISNKDGYLKCRECNHYHEDSCKYCRNEDYDDYEILNKAMELLNCDRQFLINEINKTK
ncbi:hypothetical protein FC831_13855 [Clostridium botulinum]|nr:hypothetical protein [Clostridium botulinum]